MISVLSNIDKKHITIKYFFLTLAIIISAVNFNLFLRPMNLVTGGSQGIAIILNYTLKFNISLVIAVIFFLALIISYLTLGLERTKGILVASILFPIFVKFTENITQYIQLSYDDKILISIFSGILGGISSGIIYKLGFSSGGVAVLSPITHKYAKIPISRATFLINTIILLFGGLYFGILMCLYAIIVLYINSVIMNRIILGISSSKAVYIYSEKQEEINDYILKELNYKTTILKGSTSVDTRKKDLIFVVIPTREYIRLTDKLKEIDHEVFYTVCDSYEVNRIGSLE